MFQLIHKTVTTFSVTTNTIAEWESKRLSYEKINPILQQTIVFLQKL